MTKGSVPFSLLSLQSLMRTSTHDKIRSDFAVHKRMQKLKRAHSQESWFRLAMAEGRVPVKSLLLKSLQGKGHNDHVEIRR
jgi:hypothetical protein